MQIDAIAPPDIPSGLRFRSFVDESRDEIFIVDHENVVEYMNPAAREALGVTSSPVGRKLAACFAAPFGPMLVAEIDNARAAQRPVYSERSIAFARGERWMSTWLTPIEDADGRRTAVMGVARDITHRHELGQALARQHQVLETLVAATPIGIALLNDSDGWVCALSNPVMRRLTGDECIEGARLSEACPLLARLLEPLLARAADSDRPFSASIELAPRHFSITAVGVHLPGCAGNAVLVLVDDVTERRQLEQQLLHADKMDAIGRLAGGIAHDFNNLLTPILGYTELVAATLPAGDPRHKDLDDVSAAARSATALTRQLLTFSRKQVTTPAAIDLNDVVQSLDAILRRTIGEDVKISLDLAPRLDSTIIDGNQVQQVVMNLCVNARDAMPRGGTLTLTTRNAVLPDGGCGALGPIPPGRYVTLTIADTGTGISSDVQAHIFEPFFTTKGPGEGTGLGLSIVHGIMKQAGGYVALASTPNEGTSFTMYFPRTDSAAAPRLAERIRPLPEEPRGGETVLVVEDHDGLRRLAERLLRNSGYNTLTAQSAGEAIEVADAFTGTIDVLLSDVVMPDVDGVTLARQMKKRRPGTRVLFMSGYSEADVARHSVLPPNARLLQKPFTRETLLRALRDAADARRGANG